MSNDMTRKVLIVEDSGAQARVIAAMFEKLGFLADCVDSHEQALERLRGAYFDLLLLDVFLENDNSLDHLHEYKALQPGLTIAVMTAGDYSGDSISEAINRARRSHVDYVLAKPFKLIDVEHVCDELERQQMQAMISIDSETVFIL
jgi:DNA-binding NtrC family response regulator